MRKGLLVVTIVLLVLIIGGIGGYLALQTLRPSNQPESPAASPEKAEFQLTGWKVIDIDRGFEIERGSNVPAHQAVLSINYTNVGYVGLYLTNPEGTQVAGPSIIYTTVNSLPMTAKFNEVPISGQYKLIVKDNKENVIATETFTFVGAKMQVSAFSVQTSSGYTGGGIYLMEINLKLKNDGDLPFYLTTLEATTSEENQTKEYYFPYGNPHTILQGEEKDVKGSAGAAAYGLRFESSGEKTIVLNFKDNTGKVVYSYSATIEI